MHKLNTSPLTSNLSSLPRKLLVMDAFPPMADANPPPIRTSQLLAKPKARRSDISSTPACKLQSLPPVKAIIDAAMTILTLEKRRSKAPTVLCDGLAFECRNIFPAFRPPIRSMPVPTHCSCHKLPNHTLTLSDLLMEGGCCCPHRGWLMPRIVSVSGS